MSGSIDYTKKVCNYNDLQCEEYALKKQIAEKDKRIEELGEVIKNIAKKIFKDNVIDIIMNKNNRLEAENSRHSANQDNIKANMRKGITRYFHCDDRAEINSLTNYLMECIFEIEEK